MPQEIQRGVTFTTSIPDAPTLHAFLESAIILPAFISDKTIATPGTGDSFVFLKNGVLKQCTLSGLISGIPSGAPPHIYSLRRLGRLASEAAAGNDPRFPAVLVGIRKANQNAPDTVATAGDLAIASQSLVGITAIDWRAFNVFSDSLTANKTYTFINPGTGRRITVVVKLNGFTPTFPALAGTLPVIGTGTTYQTFFFTQTALGVTGYAVAS